MGSTRSPTRPLVLGVGEVIAKEESGSIGKFGRLGRLTVVLSSTQKDGAMDPPLIQARRISKRFGGLLALSDVDLDIRAGEVLALVGDNGAGKSTLIKVLCGAHPASAGELLMEGKPVRFFSTQDAASAGIATIFQELALSENLSVWENVFLARELVRRVCGVPFLRHREMEQRVEKLLGELEAHIPDPEAPVGSLSGGQRQAVAISRALNLNAKLVIMDEPTAALAVAETRKVLLSWTPDLGPLAKV